MRPRFAAPSIALALTLLAGGCQLPEPPPGDAEPPAPVPAEPSREATGTPAGTGTPTAGLALVGGRVLDGYGGPVLEDGVIVVDGDRIVAIGRIGEVEVPDGVEVVDTEGMTVMPGLFDMHVHLAILGHGDYARWDELYGARTAAEVMPIAARQLLAAGVTSARDLGADPDDILAVRERIRSGEIPGPRLFVSGPFLQAAPYEAYEAGSRWPITTAIQARQTVQDLASRGVDVIKLIDQDQMPDDVVAAIVETAHAHELPVVAHAHRAEEIRVGLRHGVDNFEHTGLGTAPGYPEDVLEQLRARNTSLYWTPTVSPLLTMRYTGEIFPERLDDPAWSEGMPEPMAAEIRDSLRAIPHLPYYALFPSRIPILPHKFRQVRETGVRLLIGTDSGIPTMFHNDSTWREMALWASWGVPAMEVIQAATLWPARFLGVEDDLGTLAPGRLADVIAVRGDPLTDMGSLSRVEIVVQGGRRVR